LHFLILNDKLLWSEKPESFEKKKFNLPCLTKKKCVIISTTCILIEPDIKKTSEEVDEDDGDIFLVDYQPIQEDPIKMLNYVTCESQEGEKRGFVNSGETI